jgi:transposase
MKPLRERTKQLIILKGASGVRVTKIAKNLGIGRNKVWEVLKEHRAGMPQKSQKGSEMGDAEWEAKLRVLAEIARSLPPVISTWEQERLVDRARKFGIAVSPSYWRNREELVELQKQVLEAERAIVPSTIRHK